MLAHFDFVCGGLKVLDACFSCCLVVYVRLLSTVLDKKCSSFGMSDHVCDGMCPEFADTQKSPQRNRSKKLHYCKVTRERTEGDEKQAVI